MPPVVHRRGCRRLSFSDRVVDYVKARKDKIHSWFMDMNRPARITGGPPPAPIPYPRPPTRCSPCTKRLLPDPRRGLANCWARHQRITLRSKPGWKPWTQVPGEARAPVAADERRDVRRGGRRKRRSADAADGVQPGDRRRAGAPRRQDLALSGLLGYSCRPDNVMLCCRRWFRAQRHGLSGARGRRGSGGARRLRCHARQGSAGEGEEEEGRGVAARSPAAACRCRRGHRRVALGWSVAWPISLNSERFAPVCQCYSRVIDDS